MSNQLLMFNFLQQLRLVDKPLRLRCNGQPPEWDDRELHQEAYNHNPELYGLLSVAQKVQNSGRDRILFQLLQSSRQGLHPDVRLTLENVTNFLLTVLHPDTVLTVFLALRRVRANHKHTTRTIVKYIFQHPHGVEMAICRRPAVVDALEHALGKNVARACAKILTSGGDEAYLHRNLLRFISNKEQVKLILRLLYRQESQQIGNYEYRELHKQYAQLLQNNQELSKIVTPTNRGDIAATLVHIYRGGKSDELLSGTAEYVRNAAMKLPKFDGTLAVVFDASASTRSYGDREFCCLAQSVALKMLLEKCCTKLKLYQVGGTADSIPLPEGHSDIATGLLDALKGEPDLVAIISDGYENVYPGDLQRVVATLPQIGVTTPVVFCHSKFTNQDDLEFRRPATNLPQLEFWHQADFESLLLSLFLMSGEKGANSLRNFLSQKLAEFEFAINQPQDTLCIN